MLFLIVLLAFVCGALLVLGWATPSIRRGVVMERLDQIAVREELLEQDRRPETAQPRWRQFAGRVGEVMPGRRPGNLRTLLDRAGRPGSLGVTEFMGLRALSGAGSLALAFLTAHVLITSLLLKAAVFGLCLVIGVTLPEAWLHGRVRGRQAQVRKSLPDVLDLLVVSVEAGVGFDGAVAQVAAKMAGPLPEELQRALDEMRLGKTRTEALRGMAARLDVAEVTGFVAAVTQADRLGAGVSAVLRVQSKTARERRMQRIREEAARLPTKMLFPLVFFVFPALFVVLLGPGLINLLKTLGPH